MNDTVADRLDRVRARISAAEAAWKRNPGSVRLLAVSKTKGVDSVRAAVAAGQHAFGENYLQDALGKIEPLRALGLEWHFIGPLQANKTRRIAECFDWVHTIDRERVARRLDEQRPDALPPLSVCLQVRLSDEDSKSGVEPEALPDLAAAVAARPRLRLRGLMGLPAASDDFEAQRRPFRLLKALQDDLILRGFELDTLSMGMSGDLEAAIAEGSTLVRIGTDIFGART